METTWESELASFLTQLSAVQDETLDVLARKRQMLAEVDTAGLAAIAPQEEQLMGRLQGCLEERERLLARAARDGLPTGSIKALTRALPRQQQSALAAPLASAASRMRLLQHHSLTNWVIVQRTLLHLSQMLEIIATGGRLQPTYDRGKPAAASGALVDRAV